MSAEIKSTSSSERVLIVGIDSFTGYHLESHLKDNGYEVFGTVIYEGASAPLYTCDIRSEEAIEKVFSAVEPDYVIHLSGISFQQHGNATDFYNINVIGAENVLKVASNHSPKKVIMASSATVYGAIGDVLHEGLTPEPVSHYGVSKLAMEKIAAGYFNSLDIIITRPFNYTGYKQDEKFVIPKIVAAFKERRDSIDLGNINTIREYNDIRTVVEVYRKLMESDCKSEIVNICSNRGFALTEVLDTLKEITGHDIEVKVNQAFIRKNEIMSLTGSNDKLKSMIGDYSVYPLESLLRSML